ncbi:hypothetical protein HUU53_04205 [Candidatus Micrarchaeota archaeon]|nr:hypothetical protein [Candidatus Micrarchaeota archaeon]
MKNKMITQGVFLLGVLMIYLAATQFNQYIVTQATIDTQITVANQLYPEESAQLASQVRSQFSGPVNTILFTTFADFIIGLLLCLAAYAWHKE